MHYNSGSLELKENGMPRTKKRKMVTSPPLYRSFKPAGVMRKALQSIALELDEYEAIKLADYKGLNHADAATEMEISRSTFSRLIERARNKMARFLIEGKEIQIDGGNIHFRGNVIRCLHCGHMFNTGIESRLSKCPECDSTELLNFAGSFGHGRCCTDREESGE